MGFLTRVFVVILSLLTAVLIRNYYQMTQSLDVPKFDLNEYWGPGNRNNYKEDTTVKSFDIGVLPETINNLQKRLSENLELRDPLEGVGFEYGFNTKYLKQIINYWRDVYLPAWSQREAYLAQFPHFQTQIQGLRLHFIHAKPKNAAGKTVLPLLLLHGWPGSVREFYDIIPLLTTANPNSDYVFEVIAPSLPGYGWSQGASKVNFGPAQMSIVLRNLMLRLGFKQFVIQGGDWGSMLGSNIATIFPENTLGYHSNMCHSDTPLSRMKMLISRLFPSLFFKNEHREFYQPLGELFSKIMEEMGYMHLQATKPDTIGTVLHRNPVGLAAYILEKFSGWTHSGFRILDDGGLTKRFTLTALLDNIMIYYLTDSITTSQRLYSEALNKKQMELQMGRMPIKVPVGCARFFHDLMHQTDCELKEKHPNLIHSTYHSEGGHFIAMEQPKKLYEDFMEFIEKAFKKTNNGT